MLVRWTLQNKIRYIVKNPLKFKILAASFLNLL